ncbi:hypothetical protein [Fimbriiglobus ruber]|uniref:hypothetical protein n=1 Tax=Fimbriiglobus ruber TaxID=1908690 RepID=UPI00117B35A6|nr:hypothetical protein [Fimbriiglobus ruber]
MGSRHWNDDSLKDATIWSDEHFKEVEAQDIEKETNLAIKPLEDLGVLVLFSVFEAAVRDHLEGIIRPMTGGLGHPILEHAAEKVLEGIRQGSFANQVLAPLQDQGRITPQLSDKVKQVRDYRNWVAHGKREPRDPSVINLNAKEAFERLTEFLETLSIAVEAERKELEANEQERPTD